MFIDAGVLLAADYEVICLFQDLERLLDSLGCRPIAGLHGGLAAVLMPPVADHSEVGSQYLV